jgi:hypothetical protein
MTKTQVADAKTPVVFTLTDETRAKLSTLLTNGQACFANTVAAFGIAVTEVRATVGYVKGTGKHADNYKASGIASGLLLAVALNVFPDGDKGEQLAKEHVSSIRKGWLRSVGYKAPKREAAEIELEIGAALAVQALIANFTGRGGKVAKDTLRPMLAILRGLSEGRVSLGDIAKACQVDTEEAPASVPVPVPDMTPVNA